MGMKSFIQQAFFINILLLCNNNLGYFYQAVVACHTKKQPLIICFGDYHLKNHPANKIQRKYLDESLLKRLSAVKGKLIVEDLSSVNNDGRMICCNFGINSSEGVLGKLADKARSMGIAVENVEYRYCRVAGIGPLLNNLKASPHSFRSSVTIKGSSLYKEVMDEIEKIKKYDDGKLLNNYYKRGAMAVHAALLKTGFNNKASVADHCKQLQSKQYRQELERLCIFDSALIDMNIMHAIAKYSQEQLILVIAGGSHIEQVSSMLERMGYQVLLKTPSCCENSGLKKVLNSENTTSASDTHPKPIDLGIIKAFIP